MCYKTRNEARFVYKLFWNTNVFESPLYLLLQKYDTIFYFSDITFELSDMTLKL